MNFFRMKVHLWLVLFVAAGVVAVGVLSAVGTLGTASALGNVFSFGNKPDSRNSQVIESITRQEQVVLLSLGIQGISEKNDRSEFMGVEVPGSGRLSLMQYGFKAKLGFDGKDVKFEEPSDGKILVSIPEFIFIGHDEETFKLVVEDKGALSWITPEIDAVETINNILNDETKGQHVASNEEILKDQAVNYYKNIVEGIDPDIDVEVKFQN